MTALARNITGLELRDYQQDAVDSVFRIWEEEPTSSPLIVLPTGAGKSICVADLCRRFAIEFRKRAMCVIHVKELVGQNYKKFREHWPSADAGIFSASLGRKDKRSLVTFANVQSVYRVAEQFRNVGLLLIDECFVAGTMVDTAFGPRPIETIKTGDVVFNAVGWGTVEATSAHLAKHLVLIELSNGVTLRCTPSHPFFTKRGWVNAGDLGEGETVFADKDVRRLWRRVRGGKLPKPNKMGSEEGVQRQLRSYAMAGAETSGIVETDKNLRGLRHDNCAHHEGRRTSGPHDRVTSLGEDEILLDLLLQEARECDAHSGSGAARFGSASRDWPRAEGAGRQWQGPHGSSGGVADVAGGRLGAGIRSKDGRTKIQRASTCDLVQNRLGESHRDDCDRAGWRQSCRPSNYAGPQEGCNSDGIRVVRVSTEECGRDETVYNLQVSGHPSYFAGGVLVHNCHLIPHSDDGMYRELIKKLRANNPDLKIVGLTATPWRTNSGNLCEPYGDQQPLFSEVAYELPMTELLKRGFLSPMVAKKMNQKMDVSGVHKRGGEFIEKELNAAVNTDEINKGIVEETIARCEDRKSWLVFGVSIDHCTRLRDMFRERGVKCEVVSSLTPSHERDRLIRDFIAGRIRCLVNVTLLTTGFDFPGLDAIILARPTGSPGLFLQMCGRGLRIAESKKDCILLDFAGNTHRHGLITHVNGIHKKKREGEDTKDCPKCDTINEKKAERCVNCGHVFQKGQAPEQGDREAKLFKSQTTDRVMAAWEEGIEGVVIAAHCKPHVARNTGITTLQVEYTLMAADGQQIRVWQHVCIEHDGWANKQARAWWRQRSKAPPPSTVAEAMGRLGELKLPKSLLVTRDGQWWRVESAKF